MKHSGRLITIILFAWVSISNTFGNTQELILVETDHSQLIFCQGENNKLYQCYFGPRLRSEDINGILKSKADAFPSFGTSYVNEAALQVFHGDGNTSTELVYTNHRIVNISDNSKELIIRLKDSYYPFFVDLHFLSYYKEDIIETWSEISHLEKKEVTLYNYASSNLNFSAKKYFLTQFYGNWVDEMNMAEYELSRGIKVLDSKLGVRSDQYAHPCFILGLNQKANEEFGEVIGGTLAWPGSWKISFDVDQMNDLHVISGVNSYAAPYKVKKGEKFKTPSLLFTYSQNGTGDVTRNFHRWAKTYGIYKGERTRMTLLNNWEATYFKFDEDILKGIIGDASEMGFELFLLDDGWFGNKYPRNNDAAGLGDWQVNTEKLPNGIGSLVQEATNKGIKFGIWLEPEMVNPKSELYEKHPDWVIGQPNRPLDLSRNQLILDLSNPEVQDFVYNVIDRTLTENKGIAYIKWDCNRFITNSGSYYLSEEYQSHLWYNYVQGLYTVLEKVRAKYKDIYMMECSGGGGRIDYSTLKYFDEFWISDNTDALQRIFIQWGTTYFFPAMALASHVSVVPNHLTGRSVPLKFRFDVAMSAKLGMDLQPMDMSPEEKEFSKNAIKTYSDIREVVQFGDLYRLLSPYTNPRTAMMYVTDNKEEAVVFSYLLNKAIYGNTQALILRGLDPDKMYKLTEINKDPDHYSWFTDLDGKIYSGDFLMKYGLRFPMYNEFESKVIRLSAK